MAHFDFERGRPRLTNPTLDRDDDAFISVQDLEFFGKAIDSERHCFGIPRITNDHTLRGVDGNAGRDVSLRDFRTVDVEATFDLGRYVEVRLLTRVQVGRVQHRGYSDCLGTRLVSDGRHRVDLDVEP